MNLSLSCPGELSGKIRVRLRIPVQDYKFLRLAVVIWTTLVNTQTHIQTDIQLLTGYSISLTSAELKKRRQQCCLTLRRPELTFRAAPRGQTLSVDIVRRQNNVKITTDNVGLCGTALNEKKSLLLLTLSS